MNSRSRMDHFCLAAAGILAATLLSQTLAAQAPAPGATPGAAAEPKPVRAKREKPKKGDEQGALFATVDARSDDEK